MTQLKDVYSPKDPKVKVLYNMISGNANEQACLSAYSKHFAGVVATISCVYY